MFPATAAGSENSTGELVAGLVGNDTQLVKLDELWTKYISPVLAVYLKENCPAFTATLEMMIGTGLTTVTFTTAEVAEIPEAVATAMSA